VLHDERMCCFAMFRISPLCVFFRLATQLALPSPLSRCHHLPFGGRFSCQTIQCNPVQHCVVRCCATLNCVVRCAVLRCAVLCFFPFAPAGNTEMLRLLLDHKASGICRSQPHFFSCKRMDNLTLDWSGFGFAVTSCSLLVRPNLHLLRVIFPSYPLCCNFMSLFGIGGQACLAGPACLVGQHASKTELGGRMENQLHPRLQVDPNVVNSLDGMTPLHVAVRLARTWVDVMWVIHVEYAVVCPRR
jgi:hypothetical protein